MITNRLAECAIKLALTALLALVALLSQGCMDHAVGKDESEKQAAEQEAAIPVEAATVASGDVAAYYSGTATLEADDQALAG